MLNPAPAITIPAGYARIQVVHSFRELVGTPWRAGVNALCWPRVLSGDYQEVVDALPPLQGINPVEKAELEGLPLSEAGKIAREFLLADQELLRAADLQPSLDCVHGSLRAPPEGLFPTDVYSWHVDSATVAADTYLCTYVGAASEGLRNDQAQRRVDLPATRAALLELYAGADDAGFEEFLSDHYYDLHYLATPDACPWPFGIGHLWRIATQYPDSPVPPCIHRAPLTLPGQPARLLLIS